MLGVFGKLLACKLGPSVLRAASSDARFVSKISAVTYLPIPLVCRLSLLARSAALLLGSARRAGGQRGWGGSRIGGSVGLCVSDDADACAGTLPLESQSGVDAPALSADAPFASSRC